MTDSELRKYFDPEKIKPFRSSPARPLLEAIAQSTEENLKTLSKEITDLEKTIQEKKAKYDKLVRQSRESKKQSAEDIIKKAVKERFQALNNQLYAISTTFSHAKKCQYCDEEGMITLTSPDGQTIRRRCKCQSDYEKEYCVVKAQICKVNWNGVYVLPDDGRDNTTDNQRWVCLDNIDADKFKLSEMTNYVWTSREKAEEALNKLRPTEEAK